MKNLLIKMKEKIILYLYYQFLLNNISMIHQENWVKNGIVIIVISLGVFYMGVYYIVQKFQLKKSFIYYIAGFMDIHVN